MSNIPDYGSVVEMLRAAARRAARRYHTEQEEMESVARFVYVRAIQTYREDRGSFEAHLRFRLTKRLADSARTEARRHRILPRDRGADLARLPSRAAVAHILAELGADAADVARLAIVSRNGMTPREIRIAIRKYFKQLGWSKTRIDTAFEEITESVS
jgi:hypothetical protein